jgi:hypothetical protein
MSSIQFTQPIQQKKRRFVLEGFRPKMGLYPEMGLYPDLSRLGNKSATRLSDRTGPHFAMQKLLDQRDSTISWSMTSSAIGL